MFVRLGLFGLKALLWYVWQDTLGIKPARIDGTVYGGADVYFSAITPSASGGQPASAYFMIRDGIPGYAATVALLINLVMYTLSLLTIGLLCMILKYPLLKNFSGISLDIYMFGDCGADFLALVFLYAAKGREAYYTQFVIVLSGF